MELKELISSRINSAFPDAVEETDFFRGDLALTVKADKIRNVAELLKKDEQLKFLMCKDVTAVDWGKRTGRFTVVYHVYSFLLNTDLRLKVNLENDSVDSVTSVWRSANWYERETWDMYGVKFIGHPDLRRMYMPEEFEYHPLRKEFPVMGIPGSIPLPDAPDK